MATVLKYKDKDICFMNEDSFAAFEDVKADLTAANHDIKELTRCVTDYKAESKKQSKISNGNLLNSRLTALNKNGLFI